MTIVKFERSHKLQMLLTHVLLVFKLCFLMPEDGQGRPKHVAFSFGFNKYVVFDDIV
jgi:hypothetical protein